ncbi:MAG: FecR domain-containing protein [Kiritimatiellae bacterium]|nr:FecR domain-containing protein [Kiritimatiellia bacterium]
MTQRPQFLEAYLDGEMTPEKELQLLDWLAAAPANVRLFVRETHMHRTLRDALAAMPLQQTEPRRPRRKPARTKTAMWLLAQTGAPPKKKRGAPPFPAPRHAPVPDLEPVDAGPPSRLAKLQAVRARAKRTRLWWAGAAAAAVLVLAAELLFHPFRDHIAPSLAGGRPSLARVAHTEGDVYVVRNGARTPAVPGDALFEGDGLLTAGRVGAALLTCPDATTLALAAETEILLAAPRSRAVPAPARNALRHVRLAAGALIVQAAKRPPGAELAFTTPHAAVTVLGTRLTLVARRNATRVEVVTGLVRVTCAQSGQTGVLKQDTYAVVKDTIVVAARPDLARHYAAGLLALYTFDEPSGDLLRDVSGLIPPLSLRITDPASVMRLPDGGLRLLAPTLVASEVPAEKITHACRGSGEIAIETWLRPAEDMAHAPTAGERGQISPRRIVTISSDYGNRDFTLGQSGTDYMVRLRTTATDAGGVGDRQKGYLLSVPVGPAIASRTHLVVTYDSLGVLRLYLNGREAGMKVVKGKLSNWDPSFRLGLGSEFGPYGNTWLGDLYMVGFYSRALSPPEVREHYEAGLAHQSLNWR